MAKSKTELETEKLSLEINGLKTEQKYHLLQLVFSIIQSLSIIAGLLFALNEFVFKDREQQNNKVKTTLEYIDKTSDSAFIRAKDSLRYFRELAFAIPLGATNEDSMFNAVSERFEKATFPLSHYYNILENGIEKRYFDKELAFAFLGNEVYESIDLLGELQSRQGGLQTKVTYATPNYKGFKGMIAFWLKTRPDIDTKRYAGPQYDLDKPYPQKFE